MTLADVAEGLAALQRFMGARHNAIPVMGWEMQLAGLLGLSSDQLRFMMALLLSVPLAGAIRLLKGSTGEPQA